MFAVGEETGGQRSASEINSPSTPQLCFRQDDIAACIAQAYDRYLRRSASPPEVQYWLGQLRGGIGLTAVMEAIASSPAAREANDRRLQRGGDRESFARLLQLVYRFSLGRASDDDEIDQWFALFDEAPSYPDIVEAVCTSPEAAAFGQVVDEPDGVFVQFALETVLQRGATLWEIARLRQLLASGAVSRIMLTRSFLVEAAGYGRIAPGHLNDPTTAWLFGRDGLATLADWTAKRAAAPIFPSPPRGARFPFRPPASSRPLVSIITSLYRGGKYIDFFLNNIGTQSIFSLCELIVIDAASDEGEAAKIAAFSRGRNNVEYIRCAERIGVYKAWNMAVDIAKGAYLTNANVDDCRRYDSLELQAAALNALPFVDIVYQDVYYSFEANQPFEVIASVGFKTCFPIACAGSLMRFNLPHNAPMWRRGLHAEIGCFDESYESAADYDFWLRCAARGKNFFKLNDAHVGYFYNPDGISTRSDTRGSHEARLVGLKQYRQLVAGEFLEPIDDFRARLPDGAARSGTEDRYALVQDALLRTARQHRSDWPAA